MNDNEDRPGRAVIITVTGWILFVLVAIALPQPQTRDAQQLAVVAFTFAYIGFALLAFVLTVAKIKHLRAWVRLLGFLPVVVVATWLVSQALK